MNAVSHYCCRNIFCDYNTTFAILPAILQMVFTVFRRWCSWIPYILVSLQYLSVSLIFLNLIEWLQTSLRFTWWYINPASLPNPAQTIRYSSCLHNLQPRTLLNERLTAVDAPEIWSGLSLSYPWAQLCQVWSLTLLLTTESWLDLNALTCWMASLVDQYFPSARGFLRVVNVQSS